MSEGIKRLAIVLGCLGVVAWWTFIALVTDLFTNFGPLSFGRMGVIGVTALSFLIPFGLVHAIAWLVRGFRLVSRERERKPRAEESEDDE